AHTSRFRRPGWCSASRRSTLARNLSPGSQRPPLALAAVTIAAAWGALYCVGLWITAYLTFPVHDDVRYDYVAAQAGLRYGWSKIHNIDLLRGLSWVFRAPHAALPPGGTLLDSAV